MKIEIKNNELSCNNRDFQNFYCQRTGRIYWMLGYFGGGAVKISDSIEIAKLYSEYTGIEFNEIYIDEVLKPSRWYKGFKFVFNDKKTNNKKGAKEVENFCEYLD